MSTDKLDLVELREAAKEAARQPLKVGTIQKWGKAVLSLIDRVEAAEAEEVYDVKQRCGRCKWWEGNDHNEKGICGRTPDERGFPVSMLFEITDPYCALETAPEFGCVEFEPEKEGES